jgi:hypothetical protein
VTFTSADRVRDVIHDSPYERGPDCNCLTRWKTYRAA